MPLIALTMLLTQDTIVPGALRELDASVNRLATGVVEYSSEEFTGLGRQFMYKTGRFAQQDRLTLYRGDEEGVVQRNTLGQPTAEGRRVFGVLWKDSHQWTHRESDPEATIAEQKYGTWDPRIFGIMYGAGLRGTAETLWNDPVKQPSARKYSERVEDGLHIVTAESDVGTIQWWIDPNKGWLPVRVTLRKGGDLLAESRSVLKQFDGVWFPASCQYFVKGYKDGQVPQTTIKVDRAEFNRPEHPMALMPEDIGIVPRSTGLKVEDADGHELGFAAYLGEGKIKVQDNTVPPNPQGGTAESGSSGNGKPSSESAADPNAPVAGRRATKRDAKETLKFETVWETYTRQFIQRYDLKDDQTQKAWQICHDCQEAAQQHVRRSQGQIDRQQARLKDLREANPPDARAIQQVEGELDQLLRPVDDLFQKLKDRLDKLPTRVQRRAAGAAKGE